MPNFEVDEAREQIDIMRKEIDDEQNFYQQVMKEMQDDKGVFEEHLRSKYQVLMNRYEEVQK